MFWGSTKKLKKSIKQVENELKVVKTQVTNVKATTSVTSKKASNAMSKVIALTALEKDLATSTDERIVALDNTVSDLRTRVDANKTSIDGLDSVVVEASKCTTLFHGIHMCSEPKYQVLTKPPVSTLAKLASEEKGVCVTTTEAFGFPGEGAPSTYVCVDGAKLKPYLEQAWSPEYFAWAAQSTADVPYFVPSNTCAWACTSRQCSEVVQKDGKLPMQDCARCPATAKCAPGKEGFETLLSSPS